MEAITFRTLEKNECERILEINASQYIGRAWREVNGKRQLVEINYQDPEWPNGYEEHLNGLKNTIARGGSAIGAFDTNQRLVGFGTLNREVFGEKYRHVLLDQLFISLEKRGCGIGKALFMRLVESAKEWNAEKIYICAGSAEETIAFYKRIGCVDAEEVQREYFESDPRDWQLEFDLRSE